MSKHIYSAGSLRAALRAGSLAARVSPNRGPVHLEVLPENALRVISTHEDAYACAYADSDRPAPAALAGLPPTSASVSHVAVTDGGRLAHRAGGTTILTTTTSGRLAVVRA